MHSELADTDSEDGRVRINGVSVWSGLNLGKLKGFLSPGTKREMSVRNNEESLLSGCP